jgi:hypothetical protein
MTMQVQACILSLLYRRYQATIQSLKLDWPDVCAFSVIQLHYLAKCVLRTDSVGFIHNPDQFSN